MILRGGSESLLSSTAIHAALVRGLVAAGLPKADHAQIYLPAVVASLLVMGGVLFPMERRGRLREVFLGAIALIAVVQLALAASAATGPSLGVMAVLLFAFFCGSNILEASQPSIASRSAPAQARGAALGFYNTLQSLGFFAGGALGGLLLRGTGATGLFIACGVMTFAWLLVAWPMQSAEKQAAQAT